MVVFNVDVNGERQMGEMGEVEEEEEVDLVEIYIYICICVCMCAETAGGGKLR